VGGECEQLVDDNDVDIDNVTSALLQHYTPPIRKKTDVRGVPI
jgi:hypothetical protein